MAVTYTWEIDKIECYPEYEGQTNVVFRVRWQYKGVESVNGKTYSSKLVGNQSIPVDSIQSFVPFENLTLQIVSSWIEAQLGEFQMQAMKTLISNKIQNQISPAAVSMNPPWAQG